MTETLIAIVRPDSDDPRARDQIEALTSAGAAQIYPFRRLSEILKLIDRLSPRDTILVARLDRLARTTSELTRIIRRALPARVTIRTLDGSLDTSNPDQARALAAFFEADSFFESDRIQKSLSQAASKGIPLGRPSKLQESDWPRIAAALETTTLKQVAKDEKISPQTLRTFKKKMLET